MKAATRKQRQASSRERPLRRVLAVDDDPDVLEAATLEAYLNAYCDAAALWDDKKGPLFRTITINAGRPLSRNAMLRAVTPGG